MNSVLVTAWLSAGAPGLSKGREGICARCGTAGQVSLVASVSKTFTAYDAWSAPGRTGTCAPCTWAYTTAALRSTSLSISARHGAQPLSRPQACELLRAGALGADQAVTVPLHPGRKHLLPAAQWGRLTVDDICLPWGTGEATRLHTTAQLRAMGFTAAAMTSPAPSFRDLRRQPRDQWSLVLHLWRQLDPWRRVARVYLETACTLTTPPAAAAA